MPISCPIDKSPIPSSNCLFTTIHSIAPPTVRSTRNRELTWWSGYEDNWGRSSTWTGRRRLGLGFFLTADHFRMQLVTPGVLASSLARVGNPPRLGTVLTGPRRRNELRSIGARTRQPPGRADPGQKRLNVERFGDYGIGELRRTPVLSRARPTGPSFGGPSATRRSAEWA